MHFALSGFLFDLPLCLILLKFTKNERKYTHIKDISSAIFFQENRQNCTTQWIHILMIALVRSPQKGTSNLPNFIRTWQHSKMSSGTNTRWQVVKLRWDLEKLNSWAGHVQAHVAVTVRLYRQSSIIPPLLEEKFLSEIAGMGKQKNFWKFLC